MQTNCSTTGWHFFILEQQVTEMHIHYTVLKLPAEQEKIQESKDSHTWLFYNRIRLQGNYSLS